MLNINHPRTKFIFQAAGYLDRIKGYCQQYIYQPFPDRLITFDKMKTECELLDKFSESIFPERLQEIKALTEKIIIEINILSKIDVTTKPENCQVCDSSLHTFKTFVKEFPSKTICKKCPSKIINYLTELEDPTETMWI